MPDPIGYRRWAIAEGHLIDSVEETACILNASEDDAHIALTVFFSDRDPAGPYELVVPARRTLHMNFGDLDIPRETDYSSVLESDVPVVVQHTRAEMTTIAYAGD
jgi:hypothetical protein